METTTLGSIPLTETVDVAVIGGGTAGAVAAIQSARAGANTCLIEIGPQLGGTMTTGGVSGPAYFFSRHRQIIAGIGWELVTRTIELDGGSLPDFMAPNPRRPSYHVGINPYTYALLAEEACLKAGVRLHYHETPVEIREEGDQWVIRTAGKSLQRTLRAKEIVDCTGDADAVGLLGLPRVRDEIRQPGTLTFRLGGYDPDVLEEAVIQARYEAALKDGTLRPGDFCYAHKPFRDYLRARGSNQQHIFGADSSTSETQTQASVAGRQGLLRMLRFLRTLPGCKQARIERMAPMAASRETWRIDGETWIRDEDYLAGRVFEDAVCYSLYFIDIHNEEGTQQQFLPDHVIPTIPMGALIPRGSRRILVAGRNLACDHAAFSALRVEASCMAMGQAAGAAAALGVRRGQASRDVPVAELRDFLRTQGALVPEVS
ncbi:MAG: FAD-dependent oxidoreductase [Kiritimatiellia bacterium]|nr:FAD-dependent oxidoreductase [Kiritimatiellia bacterium]